MQEALIYREREGVRHRPRPNVSNKSFSSECSATSVIPRSSSSCSDWTRPELVLNRKWKISDGQIRGLLSDSFAELTFSGQFRGGDICSSLSQLLTRIFGFTREKSKTQMFFLAYNQKNEWWAFCNCENLLRSSSSALEASLERV